jgi:hypothetical protein
MASLGLRAAALAAGVAGEERVSAPPRGCEAARLSNRGDDDFSLLVVTFP